MANFVLMELLNDEEDETTATPRIRTFRDLQHPFTDLSEKDIYERYRFPRNVIFEIVNLLKDNIERPTRKSRAIPALFQMCIELRYLASNGFQQLIGDSLNVHKSMACRSIWRFAKALATHLNDFVKWPTENELLNEKRAFYNVAQFPQILGIIDGSHVEIKMPTENPDVYVNRKGFESINVQVICKSIGSLSNVVVQWPGIAHDSRIFQESNAYTMLENGPHQGHLLGDSGYTCRRFLLTSCLHLVIRLEKAYNKAHRKTRVLVEQVLGHWKRFFLCLRSELRLIDPEKCCLLITCCAILHNIAVAHNLQDDFDEVNGNGNIQGGAAVQNYQDGLDFYRDAIVAQHFAAR